MCPTGMHGERRRIKLVLTGGAWAGKTTLARQLAAQGGVLVREAALHVIDALTAELGLDAQARWRAEHPVEFQRRIAHTQLAWEAQASDSGALLTICDRGLPDGLAYLRHAGVDAPEELRRLCASTRYDLVLVLETLDRFDPRADTGRTDAYSDSLALCEQLLCVYAELGHAPLRVPALREAERLDWIRRECARLGYPELS